MARRQGAAGGSGWASRVLVPGLALLAVLGAGRLAIGQENPRPAGGAPDLRWEPAISDVPLVDLSGTWAFLPDASDPMVEQWVDVEVLYRIQQLPDRIVLDFRPENGANNLQGYRWDGTVSAFERGDAQVRERARWTDGGRTLLIEGRWWTDGEADDVTAYTFRYRLERPDRLLFVQSNDSGETRWLFGRR